MFTRVRVCIPACNKASVREIYESLRSIYLPTIAIFTSASGSALVSTTSCHAERSAGSTLSPNLSTTIVSSPCSFSISGTLYKSSTSTAEITARSSTFVNNEILVLCSAGSISCDRQTKISGWIPIERNSFTECCVGFVLISEDVAIKGTSVRWIYIA